MAGREVAELMLQQQQQRALEEREQAYPGGYLAPIGGPIPPGMLEAYAGRPAAAPPTPPPKGELAAPPVALGAPPTQLSMEMARRTPRGIPTGGISAVQRRLGALKTPQLALSKETEEMLGLAEKKYGVAAEAQETVGAELETMIGNVATKLSDRQQKQADIANRREKYRSRFLRKFDEADLERRYAGSGLQAPELERVQSIASGRDLDEPFRMVSDEEQQAAQRKLNKWESVDPERALGGAKRVFAAIASALGAYASAMTGAPNFAAQTIKDAIARDIDEQRFRFARAKERAEELKDRFAVNMTKFDTEEEALAATWNDYLWFADFKLKNFATRAQTAEQAARITQVAGMLGLEKDKIRMGSAERATDRAMRTEELQLRAEQLKLGARTQAEMLRMKAAAPVALRKLPTKVVDEVIAYNSINEMIGKAKKLWNAKIKGEAALARILEPGYTFRDEWETTRQYIALQVGRLFEKGRMTNEDYERYLKLMPSVGDWSKTSMSKLGKAQENLKIRREQTMKTYGKLGYETIEEEPTMPRAGAPERVEED